MDDRPASARFGALVRSFRQRAALSQNELARRVGVDPAYVNRIEAAPRSRPVLPRRPVVERLAFVLGLSDPEADRLFVAAGHAPRSLDALGDWDDLLTLVASLLADPRLDDADRDEFRAVVRLVARRWRGRPETL